MEKNRKIKICFVSGGISRSGGTERVGSRIANSLSENGYDVSILSCWNHGEPHFELNEDVKVFYLLNPKTEGKLYRTYVYPILKMHNFIKKNEIDILIDIDTELSIYSAYAIRGTKCKLISWEHFNYWTMLMLGEKRRFRAKKLIKRYASKLVVLTEEDREAHMEHLQFSKDSVQAIQNPCMTITDNNYNFSEKTFVSLGRLVPQKGYDMLIDAWSIVEQNVPDWRLVIVGSGHDEAMLKEKKDMLGLNRICFVGQTKEVEKYYSSASCYVLSSRYEGFPMVILEAESYGLPIIAFDCKTGPKDLVKHQKNGYLVEDGNIKELAKAMIEFTKDKAKAEMMSKESKQFVSQFDLETITRKWDELFKSILKED